MSECTVVFDTSIENNDNFDFWISNTNESRFLFVKKKFADGRFNKKILVENSK